MEPDDYPLRVGDTFASNTDLQTYMTKVIDDTGELFTKLRSDKLYPSHFKNASLSESEIDNVIKKLEYLRITYKCKYGAPTQKSKQNVVQKKRNTSTFNHDCPSYIKLHKIQKDGEFLLEVYETDFNHKNHPANSKVNFMRLMVHT
ncbi:uncharacterized protein LOC141529321 [Cotesia typhae]|uniref:uncharacterized protein LOC141529321 n=1 Tax=Cotesia typhae TaxID=2053667 RepID=UPI003D69F588